ncbi:class I SAM-dependent methyltransferase [Pedobacter immunditicola]|uniref:class I SAM-dependent methyltransferase n=1 Tax=Pedobacter immunditicola TaxID=3133440 RepID=UPI00309FE03D
MLNNYDKIAPYYDVLSRLLFHRSQVNAQIQQLKFLPSHSRILIAGGGTGWILEELAKIQDRGLDITYVEISTEMIRLAKKRNTGENRVEFVNCAMEEFTLTAPYDIVHTAFLFDNFARERTATVFRKLHQALKPGGLWFYTDFSYQPGTDEKWKGILLRMMYSFFRKIANVEAASLPDTSIHFEKGQYVKLDEKAYYRKFIKAIIYKKAGCITNDNY